MPQETNTDDLTDAGCEDTLHALTGMYIADGGGSHTRKALATIVANLDRASPDWPQRVLGLPPVQ